MKYKRIGFYVWSIVAVLIAISERNELAAILIVPLVILGPVPEDKNERRPQH